MNNDDCLRLQVSIIFLLLALVAVTAINRHPDWFGDAPVDASQWSDQPGGHRPLITHLGANDVSEQMPGFALKLLQSELLDRSKVGRARLDRDAGQQAAQFQALDAGRLLHDVFTR